MRIPNFGAGLLAGAALAAAFAVMAKSREPSTIETCAALMPDGKRYGFAISGTADTTGTMARVTGTFSVSDPTLPTGLDEPPAEARAFVECMATLIE